MVSIIDERTYAIGKGGETDYNIDELRYAVTPPPFSSMYPDSIDYCATCDYRFISQFSNISINNRAGN